jgi:aerobic carbon-monoxide dehydrogenase large subunit
MIGQPLARFEDERLLTGKGCFADDLQREGQAWCAILRSPYAHARIISIDKSQAACLAVLTAGDYMADGLRPIDHIPNPLHPYDLDKKTFADPLETPQWPLAQEVVRHVGEPVAAVIAESPQAARDAAERVEVNYEPLPLEETVCVEAAYGDAQATQQAFSRAAAIARIEFHHQRVAASQIEPRSALGEYDPGSGRYVLTTGSQGVARLQHALSEVFALGKHKIRVVTQDVGGAFGPRSYLYPEQVLVLWAAKRVGRPVKWTSDRAEAFLSDFQGRDCKVNAALAVDAQGRILGYRAAVRGDIGAHTVTFVPLGNFRNIFTTVYHVPAVFLELRGVKTNSVPTAPYRGAGRPEAHHAIERLLDIAARRLSLDRAEIRRRNLVRKAHLPYRTPMGLTFDSGDFLGYMERALALAEYGNFVDRKEQAKTRGRLRGIGIANYVESPAGARKERVELSVSANGVEMIAGTQSTGQGHETSFVQALADRLGIAADKIRLRTGDTDLLSGSGGTHSDRSMRLAGTLIVQAADAVIDQGRERAAALLEAQAVDIEFASGKYRVAGTDRALSLFEVAKESALAAGAELDRRVPAYPAGAAVCEVEIDRETGAVDIVGYASVDDVGQPINPMIVDGQTHGGIAQGIGQALTEAVAFEPSTNQVLTASYMDYGFPRAPDLPSFRCELAEHPTAGNPLRVKGGGEGGVVPATAAVMNAICDALDVDEAAMPTTPLNLWKVLQTKA